MFLCFPWKIQKSIRVPCKSLVTINVFFKKNKSIKKCNSKQLDRWKMHTEGKKKIICILYTEDFRNWIFIVLSCGNIIQVSYFSKTCRYCQWAAYIKKTLLFSKGSLLLRVYFFGRWESKVKKHDMSTKPPFLF